VGYRCKIGSMPLLDESRKRFLAKFFVVGACAPAVWVSAIYALRDLPVSSGLSEVFGWVLYSVYFVTFPTQVIFLDAEHLPEILFSLVIAAPMNGAWYVFVAILFWLLRDNLRRLPRMAATMVNGTPARKTPKTTNFPNDESGRIFATCGKNIAAQ